MSTDCLLITGASSDLAADLVRRLMQTAKPPRVLAHYHRNCEKIHQLQAEFKDLIVPIQADLSVSADVQRLIDEVQSQTEALRKIVHFAGPKLRLERFPQADLNKFEYECAVQLNAIVRILQKFLPAMARSDGRSKVVLVLSSVTLGVPPKFMSLYTVVKFAQLGLLRALATEYAGTSVDINAVSPSMVETQFLSDIPPKAIELAASQNPQGRNVTIHEVTAAIEFLLSSGSDRQSGLNLPVTGGALY